mmetsp:Transcript_4845/g.19937  ORF Transcript_4845/g.19937 Transcript_4845/m.19937 type:complete len:102 (+) Transcript_4845:752-1057(+)
MLRLFDVKSNVQQAKHRRTKCDEPGEVRRARSGGRRRRLRTRWKISSFQLSSPAPDKFDVPFGCVVVHPNDRGENLLVRRWTGSVTAFLTVAVEASGVRRI